MTRHTEAKQKIPPRQPLRLSFPQALITTLQEKEDPTPKANNTSKKSKIHPYLVLLFLLSTVMAPVPICTEGPLGKG